MIDKLGNELTSEHKKVLAYFYKSQKLNERRKYTILLSQNNNHFEAIQSLKKAKLIEVNILENDDLATVDLLIKKFDPQKSILSSVIDHNPEIENLLDQEKQ